MPELSLAELAEEYKLRAQDCYRNAREARVKRKAAWAAGDMKEFEKWAAIARDWGRQGAQLRRDAARLYGGPLVGQGSKKCGAAPMEKW